MDGLQWEWTAKPVYITYYKGYLVSKEGLAMALATITTKGQVTIPKSVRNSLILCTGDKIEFVDSRLCNRCQKDTFSVYPGAAYVS